MIKIAECRSLPSYSPNLNFENYFRAVETGEIAQRQLTERARTRQIAVNYCMCEQMNEMG
jgi:hypothetical protein